jgi:aminoglycoside phosphotransferase (APT) family kinase protein
MRTEELLERLPAFFAQQTGATDVSVSDVRLMTGGAVRETWRLDATLRFPGGQCRTEELVLLSFQPSAVRAFGAAEEFRVLEAARATGAPVPEPLFVGEGVLDQPFYVMRRLQGESIGRRIVKEAALAPARAVLPSQLGESLARIHRVPPDSPALAFLRRPPPGVSAAVAELDTLEESYRAATVEPHPAFELTLRWLRRNAPPPGDVTFVHGDYRNGNVMVGEEGLRGVLDWELAHIGDPMEDLGWMCVRSWRFGVDNLPVGGIGERAPFYAGYAEASGRPVDPERVHYWEVYGNLRWGVFTLIIVRPFLDGVSSSVEHASIGRRTAETEYELLKLIGDE